MLHILCKLGMFQTIRVPEPAFVALLCCVDTDGADISISLQTFSSFTKD